MHHLRVLILIAFVSILALSLFALAGPVQGSRPPIIIKGGSLEIDCGDGVDCLESHGNGHHRHKDQNAKIHKIVVKDENGAVLGTFNQEAFPHGKPSVEISYY
jgi:hypothetical protein